ncbi:MAG: transketolase C-terminal domain-containing protein [Candidatus Omnitrophota bacterium]
MKEFLEGSKAVAETINLVKPGVISAYPITPQTHIVEDLSQMVADGKLNSEFINVESEHSAASVVLGASAAGVRVFSATSSQGLLLMTEVIFNIAGMRLPVVLTCANRAISAPINIWNDHQDAETVRDSGWIQFYGENTQEVCDLHLLAYRLAEHQDVMLPVMVNLDGYILTHGYEVVDIASQADVDKFLPPYKTSYKLDIDAPISMGLLGPPDSYTETRFAIQETMKETLKLIPQLCGEFEKIFGRKLTGIIEEYKTEDADMILVAKGSVVGTIKETVDKLREEGVKIGVLKVVTYRPFPSELVYQALRRAKKVAVIEKAISLGSTGPMNLEICNVFAGKKETPEINGFVIGLGGRDIRMSSIENIVKTLSGEMVKDKFIDLKEVV